MNATPEPAHLDEVAEINALLVAAFDTYSRRLGREKAGPFAWVEEAIAAGAVYVVHADSGLAAVIKLTDTPAEESTTLDILAVAPAFARQGLGSALLDWVENRARTAGRTVVKLYTAAMMTHLVALYSRHGYEAVRVGPHLDGRDPFPRVFMQKSLVSMAAQ